VNEEEEENTAWHLISLQGYHCSWWRGEGSIIMNGKSDRHFHQYRSADPDAVIQVNGRPTDLGSAVVDLHLRYQYDYHN
jgi:hypothetical protein